MLHYRTNTFISVNVTSVTHVGLSNTYLIKAFLALSSYLSQIHKVLQLMVSIPKMSRALYSDILQLVLH